ncbi:mitochondrial fission ELM1 family protein [Simiduia sp. 21SJ11W-1]|uniref:mitochondrial fission ELM1 family protein n=1 Tax=Simiduia sp. 21SJ11W-1 TaxID=2909669 RepID=UPI00209F60AC|nr:ELM1/GtrOC1 family putative glycosyltransferase [Simiduia sp. 21SJ11W-1]UTA47999.1 mitochondrial fission ELM1 family protein [Simiduia sp. 21SJ11W-1]
MSNIAPQVWLLTDGKPGHQNQLRGLAERLTALAGAQCHWVNPPKVAWWQLWRGRDIAPALPRPQLVLAAGSRTQLALLAAKRRFACPAVVLMRPNLPYGWFDGAIVPAHDQPPARPDVLVTEGVLNAVTPVAQVASARQGLLLLGGPSKHYYWDQPAVLAQVQALCTQAPDWQWTLSDSRRSPQDLLPALNALGCANLQCVSHRDTAPGWLADTLAASGQVWVSPDSVSMVYEALTAGIPTGLIKLPPLTQSRVVAGLQRLIAQGRVRQAPEDALQPQRLWEADRAARWLLNRFPLQTMKAP